MEAAWALAIMGPSELRYCHHLFLSSRSQCRQIPERCALLYLTPAPVALLFLPLVRHFLSGKGLEAAIRDLLPIARSLIQSAPSCKSSRLVAIADCCHRIPNFVNFYQAGKLRYS